jgi:riboflavin synthase
VNHQGLPERGKGAAIFTGIISHVADVVDVRPSGGGKRLVVSCPGLASPALGESVAINGACLTVAVAAAGRIEFDVVPETLSRTNLGELRSGDRVNLEASMRAGDELGGHLVYGHVDATTIVLGIHPEGLGNRMWCVTPPALSPMIAEKGYVALDGVSLTVAGLREGEFAIALIPETLARTTLGAKSTGASLNLEIDPIARYVAHHLRQGRGS